MKKFKSVVAVLLACTMVLGSVSLVSAAKTFSDLPSSHWAFSYVNQLVNDGTINGYTDGTFKPTGTVSRAEFVKMLGKSSVAYTQPFTDVPSNHWAYDYIMHADMDIEGTEFKPNDAITRNDVLKLLYKRAGSPKGAVAPGMITKQSDNPDAAAWAYVYGIMNGSDGVNLNLSSGLTRAEAAALICRSRALDSSSKVYSLSEIVNDDVLKKVYNSFDLFGDEYNPQRTFTNGEIAGDFAKLASDQIHVTYDGLLTGYSVDRPNSYQFYTYCYSVVGEDKMTEAFYDAKANNLDTVAAMMFALHHKVKKQVSKNNRDNFYADVKSVPNSNENWLVTSAYELGVKLDNNNNINPAADITAKNLALILLQMDSEAGFNTNYKISRYGSFGYDASLRTDVYSYPAKASDFKFVLKDVPNEVYNKDFIDENGKKATGHAKDIFRTARDYNSPFTVCIQQVRSFAETFGADITLTYYPSLVCESEKGYVMRLKIEINEVKGSKKFGDIFQSKVSNDIELSSGMTLYADAATCTKLQGLHLPVDDVVFTQIVYSK